MWRAISCLLPLVITPCLAAEPADADLSFVEEVVVVTSRNERALRRVAAQVSTLRRDDLDWQQLGGLADIAHAVPALDAESGGARFGDSGLAIRGIGGNRVVIELDDVALPSHFSVGAFAHNARTSLDPAIIEQIEVLRGPAAAIYGSDAIGGVVAIRSTDANRLIADGRTAYLGGTTSYHSQNDSAHVTLSGGLLPDQSNQLLGTVTMRRGHESTGRSNAPGDSLTFRQSQAYGKWRYDVNQTDSLATIIDLYERNVDSDLRTVLGFGRQYANTVGLFGDDSQQRQRASVAYTRKNSGHFDLARIQLAYQVNQARQNTTDMRRSANASQTEHQIDRQFQFREQTLSLRLFGKAHFTVGSSDHQLVTGIDVEHQKLTESRDGTDRNLLNNTFTKTLPPGELMPQRDLPRTGTLQTGVYVQDEVTLSQSTTLIPGLRWDRYAIDPKTDNLLPDASRQTSLQGDHLTFRLGLTRQLTSSVSLFAHYAEGFRAPPAEDVNLFLDYTGFLRVRAIPNPELKPEESRNVETGLRIHSKRSLVSLGLYQSDYHNFIESRVRTGIDPEDGALLFQSKNIESARIRGLEGSLDHRLVSQDSGFGELAVHAALHLSKADNRDSGKPLNRVGPGAATLSMRWQGGSLAAEGRLIHHRRQTRVDFTAGEFHVPGAYTLLDVTGRWTRGALVVHGGLYNITDRQYWRYGDTSNFSPGDPRIAASEQPGRNLRITIQYSY